MPAKMSRFAFCIGGLVTQLKLDFGSVVAEDKTLGADASDELWQGFEGVRYVDMQKHAGARMKLGQNAIDNARCRKPGPVFAVDRPIGELIAKRLNDGPDSAVIDAKRWTQQLRLGPAGHFFDELRFRKLGQIGMAIGMVAKPVACCGDLSDEFGVCLGPFPDHKKDGFYFGSCENGQEFFDSCRVAVIIKSKQNTIGGIVGMRLLSGGLNTPLGVASEK
jgi:hypothetical protein